MAKATCDPTSAQALGCVVLNTKVLVTSMGVSVSDIHRDILAVLKDAFEENILVEYTPEILTTSYVGPDPDAMNLPGAENEQMTDIGRGSSKKTLAILISVCCMIFMLRIMMCVAFPETRRMALDKASLFYRRKCRKVLPACSGPPPITKEELDGEACGNDGRGDCDTLLLVLSSIPEEDESSNSGIGRDGGRVSNFQQQLVHY